MNFNIINKFISQYPDNKLIIIHPLITKYTESSGKCTINVNIYEKLQKLFKHINYNVKASSVYVYRDYELEIIGREKEEYTQKILSRKTCINVNADDILIIAYNYVNNVSQLEFPIINKYHKEVSREEFLYDFNGINIHLLKEITNNAESPNYYFYISFITTKDINQERILTNLKKVDDILLKLE